MNFLRGLGVDRRLSAGPRCAGIGSPASHMRSRANGFGVRLLDVAVTIGALIALAPLMIVAGVASAIDRKLHAGSGRDPQPTWLTGQLYKSGIADLPILFEIIRGRASLFMGND